MLWLFLLAALAACPLLFASLWRRNWFRVLWLLAGLMLFGVTPCELLAC